MLLSEKQLNCIREVAASASFSLAAERCQMSQPALSNAIAKAEKTLGGKLFARTTRDVALTAFGQHLLPLIEQALTAQQEIIDAAQRYQNPDQQMLRIGFSPLVDMKLLHSVLEPFKRQHPDIKLYFKECFVDELAQRLHDDQIDLRIVVASNVSREERSELFYEDPLYYLPADGDAVERNKAGMCQINRLPDTPIIQTGGGCGLNAALEQLFQKQRRHYTPYSGQALSYQVIEDWASLGVGAGLLPRRKLLNSHNAAIPLALRNGKSANFSFFWCWPHDPNMSGAMLQLRNYLRDTAPKLVQGML
jgi:DNA-binding transcriptional LysR family regulator